MLSKTTTTTTNRAANDGGLCCQFITYFILHSSLNSTSTAPSAKKGKGIVNWSEENTSGKLTAFTLQAYFTNSFLWVFPFFWQNEEKRSEYSFLKKMDTEKNNKLLIKLFKSGRLILWKFKQKLLSQNVPWLSVSRTPLSDGQMRPVLIMSVLERVDCRTNFVTEYEKQRCKESLLHFWAIFS